jgi:integrase/ribosomal protein L40E
MAIQIYCTGCYTSNGLDAKSCSNCGVTFGRDKKYRVCVSIKGKRVTRVVDNLTIGRETEAAIKGDMVRGEFEINHNVKQVPTVGEVWKAYLKWAQIPGNKKTWITDKFNYETHVEPRFTKKHLDKVSAMDVNRLKLDMTKGKTKDGKPYLSKRGKPFSAATIKHQLVLLHRLYRFAQGPDFKYKGETPFDHSQVKMPHLDNKRTPQLGDAQLAALWDSLDTWPNQLQSGFIKLALLTGVRRSTLFTIKWEDVDFERGMITLLISHRRKGTETVKKTVGPAVMEVLKNLPRTESPYVFPGKDGQQRTDFKGPWLRIRRAAGLPEDFRFHDLRHNFASYHASNGTDLQVIQQLMNHRDYRTTLKYAHLSESVVNGAAIKSDDLLTPKPKSNVINMGE